jgi:predicted dinucleotide-utilizing enzyme
VSEHIADPESQELEIHAENPDEKKLDGEEEFEEISSDEVDRIVAALEELVESASSENIKTHLEEALNGIYYLVYDEEAGDGEDDGEILAEAA